MGYMKKTENQMSSTSNTPMDSPGTPMTLERALALHGLKEVPGGKDQEAFLVQSTAELVAQHGEDWIREHRHRLVTELEYLADF